MVPLMNATIPWIVCGACSYFLGAVPTGFLVARVKGIDIRSVGSGNIGATNVFRSVGKGWGVCTLIADVLKGLLPTVFFPILASRFLGYDGGRGLALLCAGLAVAGHNWPVYLRFKGGKGVATSMGALIGLAPWAALAGVLIWLIVFLTSRYVSLASMLAAVAICAASWFMYVREEPAVPIVFTVLTVLLVWRHRSNIGRLARGEESRMAKNRGNSAD